MIELGRIYQDKITGFKGTATGHCEYMTGCNQTLLAAKAADGKTGEAAWFDDQRLEVCGSVKVTLDNGNTPGCDMPAPVR